MRGLAAMALIASSAGRVDAALSFTNPVMTSTSFSVTVSGTVPAEIGNVSQNSFQDIIYFTNRSFSADPGFVVASTSFQEANSATFTGSQALNTVRTGNLFQGDYFFVGFQSGLSGGEAVNGVVTATWLTPVFDDLSPVTIDVYIGSVPGQVSLESPLLGSFLIVPEPSSAVLVGLACLPAVLRRRRRG